MPSTENIIATLKRQMRHRRVTYKQAGEALGLSEVSVKRLFSERSFSLRRLEKLCELVETDLGGLIQLTDAAEQRIDQLSVEQEQAIVDDAGLLLVAVCIINHWSFADILQRYRIDEHELIRHFVKLDRLNIIELLPGNRYRLKIGRRFQLQPNGPIQTYFVNNLLPEFLINQAAKDSAPFQLAWGMLSKDSVIELRRKIQRLIGDYLQIAEYDAKIPVSDKMTSSLLIMFHEDMEPVMFKARRK